MTCRSASGYVIAALALIGVGLPARAHADPALRTQLNVAGDFVLIGNTLVCECATDSGNGPAAIVGEVGLCPDNNPLAPDVYWRADEPDAGSALASVEITPERARSTAVLELPAGATVVYARLYWAALSDAASPDAQLLVQRPPAALDTEITADHTVKVEDPKNTQLFWYQSTADVTALVRAQGKGAYRIADVQSADLIGQLSDNYLAAWAMIVIYAKAGEPLRNIAIFDGLDLVDEVVGSKLATLDGFHVPQAGFDAKLGVIAYEGEPQLNGDSLLFNNVPLSNGPNPADDFFNATRTWYGAPKSADGDLPQLTGSSGSLSNLDLDVVDVTSLVMQGDTSATIEATSRSDAFLLGAFVTSIATFKPDFITSTKEVIDDDGGAIRAGDELTYRITVENTGNDASVGTVVSDPLPKGVSFVPGSLEIESGAGMGPKTDASGDDQGEVSGSTVTVRVGERANATQGGTLPIAASTTIVFKVIVNADANGTVSNQAVVSAAGEQGAPMEDTVTDGNGDAPGAPATDVTIDACDADEDCVAAKPFCDTSASPRICVECLSRAECNDDENGEPCATDEECGDDESGVICEAEVCTLGCRGMGRNGCPDGETCSSTTMAAGECSGPPDGGGMPTGGSGGTVGGAGSAGSAGARVEGGNLHGTFGGGSCDCRAVSGPSQRDGSPLLILAALTLLLRRARKPTKPRSAP